MTQLEEKLCDHSQALRTPYRARRQKDATLPNRRQNIVVLRKELKVKTYGQRRRGKSVYVGV